MSPAPRTDAQVLGEAITILRGHTRLDQAGVAALLGCEPDHLRLSEAGGGTLEGRANDTGKKIADMLKQRFQELGWIEKTDD